jgi:hypothetical protein
MENNCKESEEFIEINVKLKTKILIMSIRLKYGFLF